MFGFGARKREKTVRTAPDNPADDADGNAADSGQAVRVQVKTHVRARRPSCPQAAGIGPCRCRRPYRRSAHTSAMAATSVPLAKGALQTCRPDLAGQRNSEGCRDVAAG